MKVGGGRSTGTLQCPGDHECGLIGIRGVKEGEGVAEFKVGLIEGLGLSLMLSGYEHWREKFGGWISRILGLTC